MERWKNIPGFTDYQVSNEGRVRTYRNRGRRSDKPKLMSTSDDGNGYQKLMLYSDDGKRYCKKVHRLVAEAFVKNEDPEHNDTVDHIRSGPEGKLDNSSKNLRWISRSENIKKAYKDGVCNERIRLQKVPIVITDTWTGEELYCRSVKEAADELGVDYTSVSHASTGEYSLIHGRYLCEKIEGEDILLYEELECYN